MPRRRNHRWTGKVCRRCGCTKRAVCWVGRGFILWTYLRSDGIRFTGQAPECSTNKETVMHKKCDDCRFLGTTTKPTAPRRTIEFCTSPNTASAEIQNMFPDRHGVPIDMARQACDREDDGHFVYFEPKNNNPNGAAFVQLTRERPAPRARRHAAGGII